MNKPLLVIAALAALVGCSENSDQASANAGAQASKPEKLVIYNWTEYIPAKVLKDFTAETGIEIEYATYESNEAMYAKLKLLDGKGYDLVVPSTFYVEKLKKEDLLQPIDKALLGNFANLDGAMLNKEFDPNNVYSIPYLWGSTGIAINGDEIDPTSITSWKDLWKPEIAGQLMVMDDVRDIMGVGLAVTGYSDNTVNEQEIEAAYKELQTLWPSIKMINSDSPKTPLIQGNVNIGIMWNGEAYMAQQELPNIHYVYPSEGAIIWIDSFVIPKGAENVSNAHKFIDFMLRGESAKAAIEELGYAAPNNAAKPLLSEALRNNKIVFPDNEDIERGRLHQDLGEGILIFEKYWERLKAGK